MSRAQYECVSRILGGLDVASAHMGCCVGADEEFATMCSVTGVFLIGHPPEWPIFLSKFARKICDELYEPEPYMARNRKIVSVSQVMIAAPYESKPQQRGGTWATIRMALQARKRRELEFLYVMDRDGNLMDYERWM